MIKKKENVQNLNTEFNMETHNQINYKENLSTIYEMFCGLSYIDYDVEEMIRRIKANIISNFCEVVINDCKTTQSSFEELKNYLKEQIIY